MMLGLWDRRQLRKQGRQVGQRQALRAATNRVAYGERPDAVMERMERRLLLAAADPVISEFMADNRAGIYDRYQQNSDWIEIYNPGTTPINLDGWYLTDTASNLTEWRFPAVTLGGGRYLIVFASGRDERIAGQELHTNFKLDPDGEYLALVKPDRRTITSQFGPKYPRQVPNVSYGLVAKPLAPGVISAGATAKAIVPTGDMGLDWTLPTFDDSAWPFQGPTGVGFDASGDGGAGHFSVTEMYGSTPLQNVNDAFNLLQDPTATVYTYTAPVINLMDPQARDGRFRDNMAFKGDTARKDTNYALQISGVIRVPADGTWTFGVNSADGFYLSIDGASFTSYTGTDTYSWSNILYCYGTRTPADSLGVTKLSAGEHRVDIIFFQGTTGGEIEFYAAQGAKTSFDTSFKLVGDSARGGLPLVGLQDSIATNIQAGMLNTNASAYVRIPFPATDPASLDRLTLRMKYDDAFVAYLNGHLIAQSDNVPSTLTWNSKADFAGSGIEALIYENIDITNLKDYLSATGPNVLAIQVLNVSADDPTLLVVPELTATQRVSPDEMRYFVTPTPWGPNSMGVQDLGPIITNLGHTPGIPGDADNVVVTATVNQALSPVVTVEMHYRVNYGVETTVTMYDDGQHGDGAAGDHVYGATIPADVSKSGQMVRYYVTAGDNSGRQARWPMIPQNDPEPWSTRKWPEYQGFVISDPTLVTSLPVVYWFASNYSAAENRNGTRCSVYYNGEFYDNVFVRVRGGYATGGQKFDFNKGYSFSYDPNRERVSEINLNRQGGIAIDDAWIRPVIAFETYRDAGCPSCIAFPLRLQKGTGAAGGEIRIFIEQPDDEFLKRQGLYDNGALYKTYNSDNPNMDPWGFSKKTRDTEGYDDLQTLINGLRQTDLNARAKFIFDNVDIATFLNYQAATILVEEMDSVQKNYYLYRDTQDADNPNGTNKWMMLPWDKHLTFGKNYGISDYQARDPQAHPFFADRKHPKIDGSFAYNMMIDAILSVPVIKQMYLRRLRTIMDQLLQPASTPYADRYYETRLDELYNLLIGDPKFKSTAASLKRAFDDIKTKYLTVRRQHLYVDHSQNTKYPDYAGIPAAQVGSPRINFGNVEFNPASGNQNEEYIELRNPNDVAVDISGWKIQGGIDYEIKPGVVIPAKGSIYLSPNVVAFNNRTTGPGGGQGLLVTGPYPGQLSARGETLKLKDGAGNTISSMDTEGNATLAQQCLRITEIMYNPPDASGSKAPDNEEFEYVELQNISTTQSLNLKGISFIKGIDFTFGDMTLQPGQYVLVVKNRSAFESRYGTGLPIAGEYPTKYLSNSGDRLHLVDAAGESILDFSYEDSWYTSTDHDGRSLVIVDPAAPPSAWDNASNWRPSTFNNGSPGQVDPEASQGAPTVKITPVQPEQRYAPVDSITIVFSEPITGFTLSNLKLTRDGSSLPQGGGPTLSTADNITWVLNGLTDLTKLGGEYKLTVNGSSIIDRTGHPLAASDSDSFTISASPLAASIAAVAPSPRNVGAGPFRITFNRPVEHFGISDLRLTREDSDNLLTGFERLTTNDHITWQLFGVSALTGASGTYTLTLDPATVNITDKDGFALMAGDHQTFTVDATPPTASIVPATPDPKTGVIDSATITFSEPITGFDMSDIQLLRGSDPVSLGAAPTVTTTDNITWTLSGFSIILSRLGSYQLLIKAAGSGITDQAGNPLAADARGSFVNSVIFGDCSESNQNILLVAHATDPATLDVYMNFMTTPTYTLPLADLQQISIITGDANDTVSLSGPIPIPVRFLGGGGTNVLRLDLEGGSYTFDRDLAEDTANLTLNIQNSTVTFQASQRLGALNLSGGANVALAANGQRVLVAGSLSIDNQSVLDLTNNSLILAATAADPQQMLDQVTAQIRSARGTDGTWLHNGVGSSAAHANKQTGLAVMLNDNAGKPISTTFAGQSVSVNDILVKYTWNGDVNLDGKVDAADYFLVDSGFITQQGGYRHGDLNFDGAVDAGDYFLIDSAFLAQTSPLVAKRVSPSQQLFSTRPLLDVSIPALDCT